VLGRAIPKLGVALRVSPSLEAATRFHFYWVASSKPALSSDEGSEVEASRAEEQALGMGVYLI
jgi:hypothetical protein